MATETPEPGKPNVKKRRWWLIILLLVVCLDLARSGLKFCGWLDRLLGWSGCVAAHNGSAFIRNDVEVIDHDDASGFLVVGSQTDVNLRVGSLSLASIALWNYDNGIFLPAQEWSTEEVWELAIAHNGQKLAAYSADGVEIIELAPRIEDGRFIDVRRFLEFTIPTDSQHFKFSPDGSQLALGLDQTVEIWNIASQSLEQTHQLPYGNVRDIAFSPSGELLAIVGEDGSWLIDLTKTQIIYGNNHDYHRKVEFSPDGSMLGKAAVDVEIWDVASKRTLHTLKDHANSVNDIAFSPDGALLVSVAGRHAYIWRVNDGVQIKDVDTGTGLNCAVFVAERQVAIGTDDGRVLIWQTPTGEAN